jgi:DNA invertase Pin-like site-specific DNA recombinase
LEKTAKNLEQRASGDKMDDVASGKFTDGKGGAGAKRSIRVIRPQERDDSILRVAPYCRVSSGSDDQLLSYNAQLRYYTDIIDENPNWELADMYADEGLTGTKTENRDDFLRLMADAERGRIDLVITKSVSRFARNTEDCLRYVHLLKGFGIRVYFEKENIDTSEMVTGIPLTVHGMAAQEEAISISKNMRWSYQRRMESGEFNCCRAAYGFDLAGGELAINEDEAKVVRRIFDMYLSGIGKSRIAAILNEDNVPKRGRVWTEQGINYILGNERYGGDVLLQKRFTTDTIPYKRVRNKGERPQYYVENGNVPIIDEETFSSAKNLKARRSKRCEGISDSPFSGKIVCPDCGHHFRRQWKNKNLKWVCSYRVSGRADCHSIIIENEVIVKTFMVLTVKLRMNRKRILASLLLQLAQMQLRSGGAGSKIYLIDQGIADLANQNHVTARLHSKGMFDMAEFTERTNINNVKLNALRKERSALVKEDEIEDAISALRLLDNIIANDGDDEIGFDEKLFDEIVSSVTPDGNGALKFALIGGLELTEKI